MAGLAGTRHVRCCGGSFRSRFRRAACIVGLCAALLVLAVIHCCHREEHLPQEALRDLTLPPEIDLALSDIRMACEKSCDIRMRFATSRLLVEGEALPEPDDTELVDEIGESDSDVLRMLDMSTRDLGFEFALQQAFLEIMRSRPAVSSGPGKRPFQAFSGILPVRGRLNSPFGSRKSPFSGKWRRHEGVDIGAPHGTPIHVVGPGIVLRSTRWGGYGNMVDVYHGKGVVSRYAHMSRSFVRRGEYLRRGDILGLVGSTGRSTGPHLHFEVRIRNLPVNPLHVELLTALSRGFF